MRIPSYRRNRGVNRSQVAIYESKAEQQFLFLLIAICASIARGKAKYKTICLFSNWFIRIFINIHHVRPCLPPCPCAWYAQSSSLLPLAQFACTLSLDPSFLLQTLSLYPLLLSSWSFIPVTVYILGHIFAIFFSLLILNMEASVCLYVCLFVLCPHSPLSQFSEFSRISPLSPTSYPSFPLVPPSPFFFLVMLQEQEEYRVSFYFSSSATAIQYLAFFPSSNF